MCDFNLSLEVNCAGGLVVNTVSTEGYSVFVKNRFEEGVRG